MAQLFSAYLGQEHETFEKNGIFDAVIGLDTHLFVDPHLLRKSKIPEFVNSGKKIEKYYSNIIHLLLVYRGTKKQRAFNEALRRLIFRETKGVFIGYGVHNEDGSAIGYSLAKKLMDTAIDILDMGIQDPEIFELIGLFEEDFVADRLSDMTIAIIRENIYSYTERFVKVFDVVRSRLIEFKYDDKIYILPKHPNKNIPLVFLPKEVLRDLPVALTWDGIDHVVSTNHELRTRLNRIIGETWKKKIKKYQLREFIFSNKNNIKELIYAYKQNHSKNYDFDNDPAGEVIWYHLGSKFAQENPITLKATSKNLDNLEDIVNKIINQFKKLLEVNGLNENLYIKEGLIYKPRHERYAQRLFFAVADTYCKANNIDISPESSSGNGPIDFKFSRGYNTRVLVEIKLTSSKKVIHGFCTQLPIYQTSENTNRSFYVVLKTSKSDSQIESILKIQDNALGQKKKVPKIVVIDALIRLSASKR